MGEGDRSASRAGARRLVIMDVASSGREGDEEELIPRQNPTSDCAIEQSCSDSEAGLIGDTYGRTLSLQISVVAMGASALVISVLPTNSLGSYSIGPAATLLLVGARIVQGLSTGGEMVGSMLYMVENVPPNRKCLVSSVPMCAAVVGTGCGYMVATTWYNEAWLGEFYTELIGERNISKLEGRSINTALLIVALGAGPALTAWVIDSLGSKVKLHACVALSGVLLALFTPPLLFLIARGNESIALVVAGQLAGIVLFTPCVATLALWLAREFPPVLQYTSLALSYNVAQCVFEGTVPYIATQIKANSDVEIAPAFYMSAIGAMGAAAVLLSRLKSVRRMSESLFRNMDA